MSWTDVTDQTEIQEIKQEIENALDGKQFSHTDDDTNTRLGVRYGTRHHIDSCSLNLKLASAKIQSRGRLLNKKYRILCSSRVSCTYVRIEYGAFGSRKTQEPIHQDCDLEVAIDANSKVRVLRTHDGTGSGDGRNRMMAQVSANATRFLKNALT